MYYDLHNHTVLSGHATLTVPDLLQFMQQNETGTGVSEHYDIDGNGCARLDPLAYINDYQGYKSDRFLLGIEIGLTHRGYEKNAEIAALDAFDYVIGSVHSVDDTSIYTVRNDPELSLRDLHERYFSFMLAMIQKNDFFHTLAHIDYVFRLELGKWLRINYYDYPDYYDAVFKELIHKGRVLELNTVRLHEPSSLRALAVIYRRYKELGGRYVTIGSDSHHMYEIGRNLTAAIWLIEQIGLTPVHFKNKKMEWVR